MMQQIIGTPKSDRYSIITDKVFSLQILLTTTKIKVPWKWKS